MLHKITNIYLGIKNNYRENCISNVGVKGNLARARKNGFLGHLIASRKGRSWRNISRRSNSFRRAGTVHYVSYAIWLLRPKLSSNDYFLIFSLLGVCSLSRTCNNSTFNHCNALYCKLRNPRTGKEAILMVLYFC